MNPTTLAEARQLVASIGHRMHQVADHTEVVICAPFVFLPGLTHHGQEIKFGAQNLSWAEPGALTGEISASQLKELHIQYVILGHSERRLYLGETDSVINAKVSIALHHKITPILCFGGEAGAIKSEMKNLVTKQFINCTKGLDKKQLAKIVYVYEPVWAISSMKNSHPADGEHALELVEHIYHLLGRHIGVEAARNIRVLYGGTVNKTNVSEYAKFPQIDGALVGVASLESENFWAVIKEFNRQAVHRL